ncbi:hypothetical protein GHT06_021130 [Daphnia sinensis]|uniref:Uncharacterized protein n=1 Tax=Daphnia sinensis TaxID=1820382 RepID=A0AAD5KIR8_9CRUS|nr:hypothetical protein GHT06_021130 [Daphnia sinensis]
MNSSVVETGAGIFRKLKEMSHSLGMPSLEFFDDFGNTVQMEIRPPSSLDYKMPHREYSTHLMRLLVNKSLSFFLEVLGQSVTSGEFLPENPSGTDPHLIENILGSLNGDVTVCKGRGNVRLELMEPSRRKQAMREGLIDGNMLTFPDLRYRSYDCEYLVDTHNGVTQCSPCAQQDDPNQQDFLPNMLNLSDLKLDSNHQGLKNSQQDDQVEPTVIEHHHHHHHHYYQDGSSPISFLYQDPNAPPPMTLTIE